MHPELHGFCLPDELNEVAGIANKEREEVDLVDRKRAAVESVMQAAFFYMDKRDDVHTQRLSVKLIKTLQGTADSVFK